MATDIISKCIPANPIDNGGILVAAPRADSQLGSNYQINTYSSATPPTGLVFSKYDVRFTGVAPCLKTSAALPETIGSGTIAVMFV